MPEGADTQRHGISRRALIRRAAATGAVAWAAPTILNMSAAGAQTQQCFAFKLEGACTCPGGGGLNPGPPPRDPSCGDGTTAFNMALAARIAATGAQLACPPPGTITSATGCNGATANITVRTGCTIQFAGAKPGGQEPCFVHCNSNCGTSVSIPKPGQNNFSHVVLIVCCTS